MKVRKMTDRNLEEADIHKIVTGAPYQVNGKRAANPTEL